MTEKCQQSSYLAETSANCIYTHRTSTSTKPSVVSSVVPSLRAIYASHSHSFFFFSSLCVCYPDLRHPIYVTHLLINYINHIGTICSAPNVLSFFCSLSALLQCFFLTLTFSIVFLFLHLVCTIFALGCALQNEGAHHRRRR